MHKCSASIHRGVQTPSVGLEAIFPQATAFAGGEQSTGQPLYGIRLLRILLSIYIMRHTERGRGSELGARRY